MGYQRLLDSGLTVKGVAERLQTTQACVREHLRILKLPDELQAKIAGDNVPLRAVKPLEQLARIHAGLAVVAAREELEPDDTYEAYSWADLERVPLEVAVSGGALPEGVYRAHSPYPLSAFTLDDGAKKDLTAIERILGRPLGEIRFDASDLEQARALGAAHGEGWQSIIAGTDIADQLVSDHLARTLKELRRRERAARDVGATRTDDSGPAVRKADDSEDPADAAREAEEARRAEREAERQAREQATRFNLDLGRALYTTLSRVRVDDAVLKILASTEVVSEVADVAMRGARFGLSGWITEMTQQNGKTKYTYLEKHEAGQRGSEYLARAVKPGEIVGRQLVLLAMATYADQNAVAVSNRSWHEVKAGGPWAGNVDELLDKLMRDNLPDGAVALPKPVLEQRQQQREERAAARRRGTRRPHAWMASRADRRSHERGRRPSREGSRRCLDWLDATPQHSPATPRRPPPATHRVRQRVAALRWVRDRPLPAWHAIRACREVGDRLSHPARPEPPRRANMPAGLTASDSMFSVREVPWHGLGSILDQPPATIAEAIERSGLGWRVEREPIAIDRGDVATVDDWWLPRCEEIPGWWANVRQDTREVLGIVRDRYRIVQNVEAFQFVDQLIGSAMHFETAGSLNGGRRVWVLARLPEHIEVGGDPVRPYVLLMNSQRMASHCLL